MDDPRVEAIVGVIRDPLEGSDHDVARAILAALDALPQAAPEPVGRKIVQIAAMPSELYCLDNDGKLWFIPDGYSDLRAGPPLPAPEGEG